MLPPIRIHSKATAFRKFYPNVFRRDAREMVAMAYNAVRPSINCDTHEPTITIRIGVWIKRALDTLDVLPNRILECRYNVYYEEPLIDEIDEKNVSDKFRFLDIVIEDSQSVPRHRLVFEAKRLKMSRFSVKKYCEDGILRFIEETYPVDGFEAVMIGFCQNGKIKDWHGRIDKRFKNSRLSSPLRITKHLRRVAISKDVPNEWMSRHDRKSGSPMLIFHILLDCH